MPERINEDHTTQGLIHLRRGGTSVVLDLADNPSIAYWGQDLGNVGQLELHSLIAANKRQRVSGGLDQSPYLGIVSTPSNGWLGTPTVEGHRIGANFALHFVLTGTEVAAGDTEDRIHLDYQDHEADLELQVEMRLGQYGLLHQRATVRNVGETPFTLQTLNLTFPLPWDATEILDTTGRHLKERTPQRHELTFGTHLRESRRGRPGADGTLFLAAGTPGFGFESGQVHAVHLAWSGNHRVAAERTNTGDNFLWAAELYQPGEIILQPGEEIMSPWAIASWGNGLNELSARFHEEWRARPQHPGKPRPVTLNTWEAVYFDHDLTTLTALADTAAEVGVERFVLDDGWFRGRRDDTAGLGDWYVDDTVWPDGLHPLTNHVTALGLEFGLWVEPEMVNPDSDLAREHPDWILRGRRELPPEARQQQVLDLSNPHAYAYVAERLHALLNEYPIGYLKWDHNRDLVDAGNGAGGHAQTHANVLAVYRLIDEIKAAHPGLEIESCASGGARVDLGILDRTDRIWTSDSLDPIERLDNQKYTGVVVPPEMMGMHLTTPHVHSTGRTVDLNLSGAVALLGHFGIEWDLTTVTEDEKQRVADWVRLAKRVRKLVATGTIIHADSAGIDQGLDVRGVVDHQKHQAFFTITQPRTVVASPTGRVRIPGLDPERSYTVTIATPGGPVQNPAQSPLEWAHGDTVLTGRQLALAGIRPPVQNPQQATVIELRGEATLSSARRRI
ncbi:alpha-galactosidase [Haematomicrobium sanguinis]|uniref:alpha-galactosidase n=1 Tax=Haematomicrobium sanguinis TaxID=479106 RepID=UPI00068B25EF|nr:alpha-galactosidase [Haematomicrobium sanguinis]